MLAVSNGCLKMEYPRIQWFTSFPIKIAINWGMDKFWKSPNNIHCGGWRILDLFQDFALKSASKSTLICSDPIDLPRIRAKSLACPAKYSFLSFIFSVAATAAARKNSLPSWPDGVKYQHPSHRTPKIWRWPELAFFRTETFQLWNNSKPANTWKLKMLAKSSGQILWPNAARNQNHWNEAGPKSSKVAFQMQLRHMSASSLKNRHLTWPQNSRNPANLQKARACGLSSAGQSENCRWPSLTTRSSPTYTYTYKLMSKEQVDHSHCNVGQPLVGLIFYLFSGLGFMMSAKNQNAGWKYEVDPVWPASQCTMWQRACLNAAAANRLTSSGFSCSCVFFCLKTFDIPCLNCRSRGKTILPKKPTVVLQTCRTPSWVAGLAAIWLGGHNVIWSNRHWAHWLPKHDKKNIRKYPKCETLWGVKNCPAPSRPSGTAMDSSFAWNCMTSITVLVPQVPSSCRRALETAMQRFSAWFPKLDNLPTALSALATPGAGSLLRRFQSLGWLRQAPKTENPRESYKAVP